MLFGILIIRTLKASFEEFYISNKKKIKIATIGLSIPLFLRVFWIVLILSDDNCYRGKTEEVSKICTLFSQGI